jgi:hypothetical protein
MAPFSLCQSSRAQGQTQSGMTTHRRRLTSKVTRLLPVQWRGFESATAGLNLPFSALTVKFDGALFSPALAPEASRAASTDLEFQQDRVVYAPGGWRIAGIALDVPEAPQLLWR